MNKHFRVSGSTFSKLEELGVSASAACAEPGFPRAVSINPACSLRPRSSLLSGAL